MIELERLTLPNGLRLVHNHDAGYPMVAVDVVYDVGSRDESPQLTGIAHLFEHLMFGGSVNVPDFDAEMERAGGSDNAWTSTDFTNFYSVLPAVNMETALRLESDRMLSPLLTERSIDVQRSVVIEEFKQVCLSRPYGDMAHHLRALAYDHHPYAWPTIGLTPDHVAAVTREQAEEFFFSHYAPNNAVLAICGDVDFSRVSDLAHKWFGSLPERTIAPRSYLPPTPPAQPREKVVKGPVPQTAIQIAFHMPGHLQPGYIECDLITDILASGRASRLYRELVMKDELFVNADASILGSEEPGLLMLSARLSRNDDASISHARSRLLEEATRLREEPVTCEELERACNRYESNNTFSLMGIRERAQAIALAEMQQYDINTLPERYRRVTPQSIQQTATRVLDPSHAVTIIYTPA